MHTTKKGSAPKGAPKFNQCSSSCTRNSGIARGRASAQFQEAGYVTPRFPDYSQERQDGEVLQALYRLCGEHPFTAAELLDEIRREIKAAVRGARFDYTHTKGWPIFQPDRPIEVDPAIETLERELFLRWRRTTTYSDARHVQRALNRIVGLQHPCGIELRARQGTYRIAVRPHSHAVSEAGSTARAVPA